MSNINRINIGGQASLTRAMHRLLKAAVDQRAPSPQLRAATNDVLDLIDHDLSTKRRKGEAAA